MQTKNMVGRQKAQIGFFVMIFLLSAALPGQGQVPTPQVEWPSGTSNFCKRLLNACFRVCYQSRLKDRPMPLSKKIMEEEKFACYEHCRTLPQLEKYCKMKGSEILDQEKKLLKESREMIQEQAKIIKDLKRAQRQIEQQKEQELRWRKRLQDERERMMLQLRQELLRRSQEAKGQQQDNKQLAAQQKALTQQQQEMRELRQQLLKQAALLKKQRKRIAETQKRQLEEEKKRLALQQRLMEEEKTRIRIQKRLADERKKQEEQRRRLEQKRMVELEKLRKQRLAELDALKQQRREELKRLAELKKVVQHERELSRKRLELLRMQQQAQRKKQKALLAKLKRAQEKLQQRQRRLRSQRRRLARRRNSYQKARKTRLKRLKQLNEQARVARRRRKRRRGPDPYKLFNQGKFVAAQRIYRRRKQLDMVKKITKFRTILRQGTKAHEDRDHKEAIPILERALTLDLELGGGRGHYSRLIRQMLANMYAVKGLLAASKHYYPSARVYFARSLRYVPNHAIAKREHKKIRERAENFYKDAQRRKKEEPTYANKLLRKALRLVARTDPLYNKIRKAMR